MTHNDMAIEAIRDELARREGWVRVTIQYGDKAWRHSSLLSDPHSNWGHPIPATLDEAAKLPEAFLFDSLHYGIKTGWAATAIEIKTGREMLGTGDTELEARFRLRLACTLADEGSKT